MRTITKLLVLAAAALAIVFTGSASAALKVDWMRGVSSPGTPARYDKVGVIKVGPSTARNVLVLEPGTSAGGTYFVPLAQWIVARAKGWQVWSIERRENLLEDQSELQLAKTGHATATQLFNYYLGWLAPGSNIAHHFQLIPDATVPFAKHWGMSVAVGDLRNVIAAAHRLRGKVVLGGHSLGGGVVTAYATWDFGGRPGADGLSGLVFDDGGSFGAAESGAAARLALATLQKPSTSPWLTFGGITAPFAGLYNATGSAAALIDPDSPSLGQASGLLAPFHLSPSVPVTNLGQYGFALNVGTSPPALAAAQAHLGTGIDTTGAVRGWNGAGALTPIKRFARMFSGAGVTDADGTEWYFPQRLTDDLGAVGNGTGGAAERVLGLKAMLGGKLPRSLLIYAFETSLGYAGGRRLVIRGARQLATQSHIPMRNVTLIDRHRTYAHNDPNGAYPHNDFFNALIPFLKKAAAQGS